MEEFGGKVPDTMAGLVKLPGVARKTASIVLWNAYGKNEGVAVDTHVKRLSFRLGLTVNTEQNKIEKDLMQLFPRDQWGPINHMLVNLGREVCMARSPQCPACPLAGICPQKGVAK
jgi:endonuclease-3